MAWLNYTTETIDTTDDLINLGLNEFGLIIDGQKTTAGAPDTTAGKYIPGAMIINEVTPGTYQNTGTTAAPVWTLMGSGGGGTPSAPVDSIQFNNAGAFGGSSRFIWDDSTFELVADAVVAGTGGLLEVTQTNSRLIYTTPLGGNWGIQVGPGGGGLLNIIANGTAWDWPNADGIAGQQLTTNGTGQLSWASAGGGTIGGAITATQVAFGSGVNTIGGSANFIYDSATGKLNMFFGGNGNLEIDGNARHFALGEYSGGGLGTALIIDDPTGEIYGQTSSVHIFKVNTIQTHFGYQAGEAEIGSLNNLMVGRAAGTNTATGNSNTFVGDASGFTNIVGSNNSFFGVSTGVINTASGNTFIGGYAGAQNTNGANNTMVGLNSGTNNNGDQNTFVGTSSALTGVNAARCTVIGYNADIGAATVDAIALGSGATATSGMFALPNAVTAWKFRGTSYTLPAADGVAGTQLTTNGAGVLSWSASGGLTGTATQVVYFDALGAPTGDANFTRVAATHNTGINAVSGGIGGSVDILTTGMFAVYVNGGSQWGFEASNTGGGQTRIRSGLTTYIWPNADGNAGDALVTDGSGVLSFDDSSVKTVKVSLSSAQILALNATPIQLLAAPGAGKCLVVLDVTGRLNFVTTPYATNVDLAIEDASTNNDLFTDGVIGSGVLLPSVATRIGKFIPVAQSGAVIVTANGAVDIFAPNGNPTAGDGTLDIYITYKIITL